MVGVPVGASRGGVPPVAAFGRRAKAETSTPLADRRRGGSSCHRRHRRRGSRCSSGRDGCRPGLHRRDPDDDLTGGYHRLHPKSPPQGRAYAELRSGAHAGGCAPVRGASTRSCTHAQLRGDVRRARRRGAAISPEPRHSRREAFAKAMVVSRRALSKDIGEPTECRVAIARPMIAPFGRGGTSSGRDSRSWRRSSRCDRRRFARRPRPNERSPLGVSAAATTGRCICPVFTTMPETMRDRPNGERGCAPDPRRVAAPCG